VKRAIAQSLAARLMALGPVEARSMFSGHGLFLDGICFALVTHDTVFLKVDDYTRPDFERAGMGPFRPWADRDTALVTFYEAPAAVVKDAHKFAAWSAKALAAAREYRAKKKPKKPRR
jgi:DNA transformation protein and related proteins